MYGATSDADAGPEAAANEDMGAPLVQTLEISPFELVPAFSPDIHDYYVRCAAGVNPLEVTVVAADGGTVALLQPITTAAAAARAVELTVAPNQAVVVSASLGSAVTQYWVRCLPPNLPTFAMTLHGDAGAVTPGYYLLGDTSRVTTEGSYAMVFDSNGVPVWYSTTSTGREPVNVDSLAPNDISFVPYLDATDATTSGTYEIHDLGKDRITYVEPSEEPLDLHELRRLANGDYLMLSDPIVGGVDLTGLGTLGSDQNILGCDVQEVGPSGAVAWTWRAIDHFDPARDTTWPETSSIDGEVVTDVFHCNSIDVADDGDLLISARNMDSVFMVSRATGVVLWKMGGVAYSGDGAPYLKVTNDPQTSFYRQHDARLLPGGQISLFDDQTGTGAPARGVIYSYDVSLGTAAFTWQYLGQVGSASMGSFRVLPDGSRIVGWGEGGTPGLAFTEVDADGADLLDFQFTDDDESYRAIKVPLSQLDLGLLRSTAGTAYAPPPRDAGAKN